jgi:dihydropteroate synthase
VQNTAFSTNKTLNINGRLINLNTPKVMGILNITPDSFYDGGRFMSETNVLKQAEKMLTEGAALLDIGGYSSRPGAAEVTIQEEIERTLWAVRLVVKHFPEASISIDTFRSPVARIAVAEGAGMVNDISGGELDSEMFNTIGELQVPYILMHMKGNPQNMTKLTHYDNLLKELIDYFHRKIFGLTQTGVKDILIDPGFGFAKTREQNFELLGQLKNLQIIGRPIMVGLSRKSMVWKTLDVKPEDALNGTTALHTIALSGGASLLRVHDVKACVEVIKLFEQLNRVATS